ncbi:hypothetical protein QAD02_001247 [Eretmocerus hayati]|uniref:Uncharacterized protein n=1 Tax=Eretmocerus hayati TaxID=131215 RepID=A0ACC2NGF1_9HYME|nr:hypothetical protein QAD02_001247 [Eretmocerus hayati]
MEIVSVAPKKFGKLKWAIYHGHREMVESLLEEDTPVDNVCTPEKDFRSPLHSSVYLGDLDIVRKLLDRGAALHVLNKNDETALMLAAKFENFDIVDLLLSNEKLKNCANRENFTHLHIACMRNRVDVVQKLLEHPSDVNTCVNAGATRWSGFTPLHFAVHFKSVETTSLLLSLGADITIRDAKKLTALHLADMTRNVQIIDMILSAHKRVAKNPVNSEGLSHFHIACTRNNKKVVEYFIRNGVRIDGKIPKEASNWPEFTGLDFAIYYDCPDVVKLLLQEGNREIFPSKNGHDRIEDTYFTGNEELVDFVLHRDRLKEEKVKPIEKPPSLHDSCIRGGVKDVRESFSEIQDQLNSVTWLGNTPLHLAVERGNKEIIEYLQEQGADLNITNADGKSPLHLAFERNMKETVISFFSHIDRIKGNSTDSHGFSHFHIACIYDQVEAVKHLINLGADVNALVDFDSAFWPGFTPLHFAAKFGSSCTARLLLDHGASYSALDKYGLSAFDVAVSDFRDIINQKNVDEILQIMWVILEFHEKYRNGSFNDRGFSLLHLFHRCGTYCNDSERDKFIQDRHNEINQTVHNLGTPWDGFSPLHFTMFSDEGNDAVVLVKMGADPSIKAANGDYPYHLAIGRNFMPAVSTNTDVYDKLLHNPVGSDGHSLFHVACAIGHVEWVKYFLDHGIDPNCRTTLKGHEFLDKTPLQVTVNSIYQPITELEVVRLLIEYGADVKLRDSNLHTPLHDVKGCIEPEVVDLFISLGADVDSRNACLETPLFTMCMNFYMSDDKDFSKVLKELLNHGADINLGDEWDRTILTVDTWNDRLERYPLTIEVILKHVKKLELAGLDITEDNHSAFSGLWLYFAMNQDYDFIQKLCRCYPEECEKELELLKGIRLNVCTTLHDILFEDLNGLAAMSKNEQFLQVISSNDFVEKYSIYGPLLKSRLRKGQERRQLMSDAGNVLRSFMKILVPQECIELILQHLSNEDLKNIITIH